MTTLLRWEQLQGADGRPILTEWGEAILVTAGGPTFLRWKQVLDEDGRPVLDEDGAAIVAYGDAALEGGLPNDAGTRKRCPYCKVAGERCLVCGGTSWVTM
jgi:hypothetical protein